MRLLCPKEGVTYVVTGQTYLGMQIKTSSNQEVINNLDCDQKGTENTLVAADIVGNGTAKVTTFSGKHVTIVVKILIQRTLYDISVKK